ncbi:phosphotransferase [Jiangella sp. DSM 45060]|uniref:phosphotransferase n=1 Tax=Jiangella sp. DSM 45060 TaxID=1798224 RepID=UPI00087A3E60|nr:phosphotransferase [Jiangella sp. DSM 45060]SDT71297.1 Phosphotransferase enzyme family protein [Jiangella sp. DSM 45060]
MTTATWSSAAWLAEATGWLDDRLADAGWVRTGPVSQPHLRPWGTVLTASTDRGQVWLKAPGLETAFEVPLYGLLARVAPDSVLVPIAADVEHRRLLLPDGGAPLGDGLAAGDLPDALATVVPQYAELQRALAAHVDDLFEFGLADMRPAALPERLDEAVEAIGHYLGRHASDDDRATLRRVAAARPAVVEWCDRLTDGVAPASIDHNDLHVWNILTTPSGRPRFYDWGDAVVAHPFASMLVTLGFLRSELHLADDDPRLLRVRDAYLAGFAELGSRTALVTELELACRVGSIARSLVWLRAVRAEGFEQAGAFARAPLETLAALLAASPFDLG